MAGVAGSPKPSPWRKRSYEAVPALSVRGPHLRAALRRVTLAWMFGVVWLSCVSGSQFKVLANLLGFNDFAFGLLSTIPFVATLGQLVAALLIERTGLLKYQFLHCALIHRVLWLVAAAIPLILPIPSTLAVTVMLMVLAVGWLVQALSAPPWLTWMGALVPRRIRGRYFAARERLAMAIQIVVVIAVGLIVDLVHEPHVSGPQPLALWTICIIMGVGAVFGIIDIVLFRTVPEVLPRPANDRIWPTGSARQAAPRLRDFLLSPLKDHLFRSYVLYGAAMTFSMTVAGWFFWLNAIDNLGFSNLGANVLFLVIGPIAGIAAVGRWGKAIDRWGRRPVLIICTIGASLSLLAWLFISREIPTPGPLLDALAWAAGGLGSLVGRPDWHRVAASVPLVPYLMAAGACLLGGATWTGISLAQTSIVLGFSDGSGQSRYVAASAVLISAGGVLGGLVGGAIAQSLLFLQDSPIRLGPFLWNNWHMTFWVAIAMRVLTLMWLVRMPDPGAATAWSLARYVGLNVYNGVVTRLFYPLRVFGWQQSTRRPSDQPGQGKAEDD